MRKTISEKNSMVTVVGYHSLESLDPKRIDAAVWEVMSDGKKRSVNEILDGVVARGFQRHIVDRRLDTLFSKKWFDHLGAANNRFYRLKPEIKHPDGSVAIPVVTKSVPQPNYGNGEDWAIPASYIDAGSEDDNQGFLSAAEKIDVQNTWDKISKDVAAATIKTKDLIVKPTDTPMVAIWKMLADQLAYPRKEIELMLDWIPSSAIYRTLVTMVEQNILVRTKGMGTKQVCHLFALADTMEAQLFEATWIEKKVPVDPLQAVLPKIPLLEVIVSIKGGKYTLADAQALAKELVDNGFGEYEDDHTDTRNLRFLKMSLEIDGVPFTLQEANTLAKQLVAEGIYTPDVV
jgi:hypothetical protein